MDLRVKGVEAMFKVLFRQEVRRDDLVRLGSAYGGWWVPSAVLNAESICYTGGIGMDISFDMGLIASFGCQVFGFDPTPRSLEWVAHQDCPAEFTVVPTGFAGQCGVIDFYAPRDDEHVSFSAKNLQNTAVRVTAEVRTVAETMAELGHDHLDLLKLDIEGAEHETLARMLADGIRPTVVCVEYDQPEPLSWARSTTRALRDHGYRLARLDGLNLTFVLAV